MFKLRLALILVFCFGLSCRTNAQIHVGPGQPFANVGAAAHARAIHAGDTVYLHAGIYLNSIYWIDSLIGTPDHWITIEPFQNDSISIHEQWTVSVAQYVRFRGLHFFGDDPDQKTKPYHQLQFDYGYECFTAIHDIIVENCSFTNLNNTGQQSTGACIKFTGTDNFQVLNCAFRDGTNITDGISLNADRNGLIRGCTFENMPGDGSHCKGGTKNIRYEKNTFINCAAGGLDVGGDTGPQFFCPLGASWEADSIQVDSNIFIGGSTGIKLSSCHNSLIYNNTCFKTTQFAFRSLNASSNGIKLANNHIYNNIFTTYSPNRIYLNASDGGDYTTEYFEDNLFHDYKNPDPAAINWSEMPGVNVSGSIIGDPLFTDTAARDFSLRVGSLAIRAGLPTIGAIASAQTNADVTGNVAIHFSITPNPCVDAITITSGSEVTSITVLDLLGREVMRVLHPVASLDVSKLPTGDYTLLARTDTDTMTERFVKMR